MLTLLPLLAFAVWLYLRDGRMQRATLLGRGKTP